MRPLRVAYEHAAFYAMLALLGVVCLAVSLPAAAANALLPPRMGGPLGRRAIMGAFRFYVAAMRSTGLAEFDLKALDALGGAGPLVICPNHPSLLDAVFVISRLPEVVCIMKAELWDNRFLGGGARLAGYIRNDAPVELIKAATREVRAGRRLPDLPRGHPHRPARPGERLQGRVRADRAGRGRPGADRVHRVQPPFPRQGLVDLQEARLPARLPGAARPPPRRRRRRARLRGRARALLQGRARPLSAAPRHLVLIPSFEGRPSPRIADDPTVPNPSPPFSFDFVSTSPSVAPKGRVRTKAIQNSSVRGRARERGHRRRHHPAQEAADEQRAAREPRARSWSAKKSPRAVPNVLENGDRGPGPGGFDPEGRVRSLERRQG